MEYNSRKINFFDKQWAEFCESLLISTAHSFLIMLFVEVYVDNPAQASLVAIKTETNRSCFCVVHNAWVGCRNCACVQ